jgi:probable HAF family extracellular repeat protein
MKHPILTVGAIALFALTAVLAHVHATPPQYSVIVLDSLGGTSSEANGINASGQVAGSSFTTGNSHYDAVRWTGIAATNLGNLGGKDAYGLGINASGQVAGYSYLPGSSVLHAVRWTETIATDLGTLGGTHSNGFGINTSGQVAGTSQIGNAATHAARWTGTTPTDLGTLGGTDSYGYGINDSGQVTGRAQTGSGVFHAVRWTDTTPTDLGTLGGDSSGSAINLVGQVAGYYYLAGNSGPAHAVRWTGTTPTDLGTLGGSTSYALGINASGDIIGDSYTADDASFVGFLYIGGKMYDLNTLLVPGSGVTGITVPQAFTGVGANSINDYGQIAAQGTVGGRTRALLLSPVPVVMLAGANP